MLVYISFATDDNYNEGLIYINSVFCVLCFFVSLWKSNAKDLYLSIYIYSFDQVKKNVLLVYIIVIVFSLSYNKVFQEEKKKHTPSS